MENSTNETINQIEPAIVVYELGTDKEYHFVNVSRKTALLSAYASQKGFISNWISRNYQSIQDVVIWEGRYSYTAGDFTVLK